MPLPKIIKKDIHVDGNSIKVKRTKVWIGNRLVKQIITEVDTEDQGQLGNEECVLEGLVKRIRKPRKDEILLETKRTFITII
jgi:hypothetical protein